MFSMTLVRSLRCALAVEPARTHQWAARSFASVTVRDALPVALFERVVVARRKLVGLAALHAHPRALAGLARAEPEERQNADRGAAAEPRERLPPSHRAGHRLREPIEWMRHEDPFSE